MNANKTKKDLWAGTVGNADVDELLDAMPHADAPASDPERPFAVDEGRPASWWLSQHREASGVLDELSGRKDLHDHRLYDQWWMDAGNQLIDAFERLDRLDYLGKLGPAELTGEGVAYLREVLGPPEERARVDAIGAYVEVLLSNGALGANYLQAQILAAGAELCRFRRACARLGVQTEYVGPPGIGNWMSSLPPADPGRAQPAGDPE